MSSIKLKGDTSGEITIQAPSVAGTNTINLQASSGTLATTAQASIGTKNLIINGDMRINQRGNTTGANGSGYFGCDRWNTEETGLGTYNVEQDTDVPSGQGFSNSLKISLATTDTVASGDFLRFAQRIEGQNVQHLKFGTSSAENFTLSFWVKSNLTGTYALSFQSIDGVSTNRLIGTTYTIDTADTWEKKTLTFDGDTAQVIRNDNELGLRMFWWLVAGSDYKGTDNTSWIPQVTDAFATGHNIDFNSSTSNYINITGVQLEVGTEATPFEVRPYDMELARCQRYCQVYINPPVRGGIATAPTTRGNRMAMVLPVVMRASSSTSIIQTGSTSHFRIYDGGGTQVYSSVAATYITPSSVEYDFNMTGSLTGGRAAMLYYGITTQSQFVLSAEL